MKTFLIYVLVIVGFFVVSLLLEDGLLRAMYSPIAGEFDGHYSATNAEFSVDNMEAKACNVNGYMSFNLKNTTGNFIDKCYVKVDLYNHQKLLADTEYMQVQGMQPDDTKPFNIKFKANHIEKFNISIVENLPDKTNTIEIFGWEIDTTNVFGLGIDISNVTIFGTKLTDIFSWNNIKSTGRSFGSWFIDFVKGIPLWAYGFGWLIVSGVLVL